MLLIVLCFCFIGIFGATNPPEIISINSLNEIPLHLQNISTINFGNLTIAPKGQGLFLQILRPLATQQFLSFTFKTNDPERCPDQTIKMDWGWKSSIAVELKCMDKPNKAILEVLGEYVSADLQECKTNIEINSSHVSISPNSVVQKLSKWERVVTFTVVAESNNPECSFVLEFDPQHNLAIFGPPNEEEETTTQKIEEQDITSTVELTTNSLNNNIAEASGDEMILWILVFVFSGAFSAAFGGVGMFFFLRYRQRRSLQKNKMKLNNDIEDLHTAIERAPSIRQPSISQKPTALKSVVTQQTKK